jgi:hypothetical protein
VIRYLLVAALGLSATGAAFFAFLLVLMVLLGGTWEGRIVMIAIASFGYAYACGYVAREILQGAAGAWQLGAVGLIAMGLAGIALWRFVR